MNPFSNGEKLSKFCTQKICQQKNKKLFGIFGQKKNGWSHKLETLYKDHLGPVLKKPKRQQFCGGSRSL